MQQDSKTEPLEEMASFFDRRVGDYERHMMEEVDGADRYYRETALLFPENGALRLLDLGCGSGLELDELFVRNPEISVTGIDLSTKMLELLKEKHADRADRLHLINGSYFDVEFGENCFDAAVSVQTMHHFTHQQKVELYSKIARSLKPGGFYVETDYTAPTQEREDFYFSENRRLRAEMGVDTGFYHYDTPCTPENQMRLLSRAGFAQVRLHQQIRNTSIFVAFKNQ